MTRTGSMLRDKPTHSTTPMVAHMMTPGVVQIPGDVSVSEAASLLDREQMPCLLVKDGEAAFGIMTSGDIVKKVVAQGLEPHDVEVRAIMSKPVHSVECDQILDDATSVMASTGTSLLIVTKQGQPVGILTARDLALAPKRCETCLPATVRVANGEGEGAKHTATIRQLSYVGASIECRTLLLPGTSIVLSFILPGADLSFSVQGTILNSSDEAEFHEDRSVLGTYQGIDVQFTSLPASDASKIRAWVLQNLPRASDLS